MGGQRHVPVALSPERRHGVRFTGDWVGPRVGLNGRGKFRAPPHRCSKYSSKRHNSSECFLKISYLFMERLGKITKGTRIIMSVHPSAHPSVCLYFCSHGTTGLPLEGVLSNLILSNLILSNLILSNLILSNLILECYYKICRENST